MLPPLGSHLSELVVVEGEILACDVVAGEVQLAGRKSMTPDPVIEEGYCAAEGAGCELAAVWMKLLQLLLQLTN